MKKRIQIGAAFTALMLFTIGCEEAGLGDDSILARFGVAAFDPNNVGGDPNDVNDVDINDVNDMDPNDVNDVDPNDFDDNGGGGDLLLRLEADLSGSGPASGDADYRLFESRERFSIEIEDAVPGSTHDVAINGVVFATITANAFGFAEIEFDTVAEPGHEPLPGNFPMDVTAGDTVTVGSILAGTLAPK